MSRLGRWYGSTIKTIRYRRDPFWTFRTPDAEHINRARLDHLASLGLPLQGSRVLEVGAGIGLLTGFWEAQGCDVTSTDAREDNVREIARTYPQRKAVVLDLETISEANALGHFDVVFCYGTLYHLAAPERALVMLASVGDMIVLETCVTPGNREEVHLAAEPARNPNQAKSGTGCRPTRPWVMRRLRENWGHAYAARTQPDHPDFPLDWTSPAPVGRNSRGIFVGSRGALELATLRGSLADHQERYGEGSRAEASR